MTQSIDFIDVSRWQSDIDWKAVAGNQGIVGAIAKATEGTSVVDRSYAANRIGCLANGLAFASYHYLHHGAVPRQMAFYLTKAQPVQGERVVIDYEEEDLNVEDLQAAVLALRAARPDLQITVYGGSELTQDVNGCADTSWLAGTSLWVARYSITQPEVAKAWPYWTAWQFTDSGHVPGVHGDVDCSTFNGSPEACRLWFGPVTEPVIVETPATPATPTEPVESDEVLISVVKLAGREVVVQIDPTTDGVAIWVDGEPWGALK